MMMTAALRSLFVSFFLSAVPHSSAFAGDAGIVNPKAISVPFVTVLANPTAYRGKVVQIYGILDGSIGSFVLWGSAESADIGDGSSMMEVMPNFAVLKGTPEQVSSLLGAYVLVEAVLDFDLGPDRRVLYPLRLKEVGRLGFRGRPLRREDLLRELKIDPKTGSRSAEK